MTVVRSGKSHPIDLNSEYPCPCGRKGTLKPIILTEAMGCVNCQQIFVLSENGEGIEQLNPSYPYKRKWRWNGKKWIPLQSGWPRNDVFAFFVIFLTVIGIILFSNLLWADLGIVRSLLVVGLILVFLCFFFLFFYRR
ncbi:MAG: hypothetical protein N3D76_11600 [Geminocystis sp.]|nr:hypothetical protein [Geminocystis sp.]